jgi:hypothetical protein
MVLPVLQILQSPGFSEISTLHLVEILSARIPEQLQSIPAPPPVITATSDLRLLS